MIKKTFFFGGMLLSMASMAEQQLPGPIQPGPKDKNYFICNVADVNSDPMSSLHGNRNLWTMSMPSGKFQALGTYRVRVMSESAESARAEIFAFYKQYAALVHFASPLYDKGTQSIGYVVNKCEADSSRATQVNLQSLPLNAYHVLTTDRDHILNFLKLNKGSVTDEQVATLASSGGFPTDAFDRREHIQKIAATARKDMSSMPGANIILQGVITLKPYSFDKNEFELGDLKSAAQSYSYSYKAGQSTRLPTYDLTVPATMLAYKPASTDEAKKIERLRSQGNSMKLRSYVQLGEASLGSRNNAVVKGTIAAIEVLGEKDAVLLRISAK